MIVAVVVALTAVGTILRLPGLADKAYWNDEVGTVKVLSHPFVDLVQAVGDTQNTPPFYYVLAWPWTQVFGTGEVGLRSLSTVFSLALIPVAYLVGRQLVSRRVGLVSAALVTFNPFLVWYGQEAKAYALLALLAGISFLLFLRALDDATTGRLVAWGVCCALAVGTHYFAVFFVAVEAAWLLWRVRPRLPVVLASAIPVLTGIALLPLARSQGSPGWVSGMSLPGRVIQTPPVFIVGFEAPAPYPITALAAVICAVAVWLLFTRATPRERGRGLLAIGIGAASVVVALVGADYFLYRNVIAALIPLLVGLACGFGATRAGRLGLSTAAALCLLSAGVVLATAHTPKFGKEDWRNAARALGSDGGTRAVVVTPDGGLRPLAYYLGAGASPLENGGANVTEIAIVAGATRPPGTVSVARPPEGPTPPAPTGFEFVRRVDARYYTVIIYRATDARWVSTGDLLGLGLGAEPEVLVDRL